MKIPKYSCSTCGKPSVGRHVSNCHYGIGKCLPDRPWDFPDSYRSYWNRWQKMRINQENFHHIRPDILNHFSSNKSDDRKPSY